MSVNEVTLIGNLGDKPEIVVFPDGTRIAKLSIATSHQWRDKQSGEKRESTEWHRVVLRGNVVNVADEYLNKGDKVYIKGMLKTRSYEDKNGGGTRWTTEVIAYNMQMLNTAPSKPQYNNQRSQQHNNQPNQQYDNPQFGGQQPNPQYSNEQFAH